MAFLKDQLRQLQWLSGRSAMFDGLEFCFDGYFSGVEHPGQLLVCKDRSFFDDYSEVLGEAPIRNLVDLGIWQGGSAVVLAALFDVEKLVAIDICDPVAALERVRAEHPLGLRIAAYYNTSQDDAAKLDRIIAQEFDGPLDLVIDDASHFYQLSKRSFEILFPNLRPGGWYVIEDWAWAHEAFPIWPEQPSLANLVFKLQLAAVKRPDLIRKIIVRRHMVFLQKGLEAQPGETFDVDDLYTLHHRRFAPIA